MMLSGSLGRNPMGRHAVRRDMRSASSRSTQLVRGASVVVALLLASSCGLGWKDQLISTVEVSGDERTLVVGYHCDVDASLDAEETADEVRLRFRVYGGNRGDCADVEQVELDSPLGDRQVIDASKDEAIVPCRAPSLPSGQTCS
jgi:hypothetical protein